MKADIDWIKVQNNMKPGKITSKGFLGHDGRSLVDIIKYDEELMSKLGLDWNGVVNRLRDLFLAGKPGLGQPVTVEHWLVCVDDVRGKITSPWGDGQFRKMNTEVRRFQDGQLSSEILVYNDLCLHMIQNHHFLQGLGSPFRLDPEMLMKILF